MMIHDWHAPLSQGGGLATPLQRTQSRPNTQTQPEPPPKGPRRRPHQMFPRHSATIFAPEGLTPGRCFKDTPVRVHPAFDQRLLEEFSDLLAQPYGLRPKYLPVPPIFLR